MIVVLHSFQHGHGEGAVSCERQLLAVLTHLFPAEVGGIRSDVLETWAGHIYSAYGESILSHLREVPCTGCDESYADVVCMTGLCSVGGDTPGTRGSHGQLARRANRREALVARAGERRIRG